MVWLGLWFHMHGLHGSYIQSNIIYTYFIYDLISALINHPTPTLPTHQLHRLAIKSLSLSIPPPPCPIAPLLLSQILARHPSTPHPNPRPSHPISPHIPYLIHLTIPYLTTPSLLKIRTHHPSLILPHHNLPTPLTSPIQIPFRSKTAESGLGLCGVRGAGAGSFLAGTGFTLRLSLNDVGIVRWILFCFDERALDVNIFLD